VKAILVFLKAARPGFVKPGLANNFGAERATEVYRNLVRKTFAQFPSTVSVHIWFSPTDGEQEVRQLLSAFSSDDWIFLPQPETDPASRRKIAFEYAFKRGYDKVLLVGTDCLDLHRGLLDESWYWLPSGERDWVLPKAGARVSVARPWLRHALARPWQFRHPLATEEGRLWLVRGSPSRGGGVPPRRRDRRRAANLL